jgi:hypothetical protein
MTTPRTPAGLLLQWAGRLRFPWLLALTATAFVVDLFVPDFIPFADEILLGLATVVLGSWRKGRTTPFKPRSP